MKGFAIMPVLCSIICFNAIMFSCESLIACKISSDSTIVESEFLSPPMVAKPYVWYYWLGYYVNQKSITKDLESMKDVGVGGFTMFQTMSFLNNDDANKNLTYQNKHWWELFKHTAIEAKRLGLEMGIHNCIGYSASGGPWITPEKSMQKLVWTALDIEGARLVDTVLKQPLTNLNFYRDIALLAVPKGESPIDKIIDISYSMTPSGRIKWKAPVGDYTIYRFGHTSTNAKPHPIPNDVNALEADKLSKEAMAFHVSEILKPLKADFKDMLGKTIKHIMFDSYEAGNQNWTANFIEEFKQRKGYNIIKFLPIIAGRIVENKDITERFKRDFKSVIADMYRDYAYELPKREINKYGMDMIIEPYGGPFNQYDVASIADIPATEFWNHTKGAIGNLAAAGVPLGRKLYAAEAFTGYPSNSMWSETPASLKRSGDGSFANGVNRLMLHHWVSQPFDDDIVPGMSMGWWGTHFGRNQTWTEPGKAWYSYLARCQYLLQKGSNFSEFLSYDKYIIGGDVASDNILLNHLSVENNLIVTSAGVRYKFLLLPDAGVISLDVAKKIKQLVNDGAVVYGPKPINSLGLKGKILNIDSVIKITDEIWGNIDGINVKQNSFGKGKIFWGYPIPDFLKMMSIEKKIEFSGEGTSTIIFNHRQTLNDEDIIFIANTESESKSFTVNLAIQNKTPELWNPETGEIENLDNWNPTESGCDIRLTLKENESTFIVLKDKNTETDHLIKVHTTVDNGVFKVQRNHQRTWLIESENIGNFQMELKSGNIFIANVKSIPHSREVKGNWLVKFIPKNPSVKLETSFDKLKSWTDFNDEYIKYFSGTAIYNNTIEILPEDLNKDLNIYLNLGIVKDLAKVHVNGNLVKILWHSPFKVKIGEYLKAGKNKLSIEITNTWANRLIGDEQYANDVSWDNEIYFHRVNDDGLQPFVGKPLQELPKWLLNEEKRPSKNRTTFTSWNYFKPESQLLPSGLIGPVYIEFTKVVKAEINPIVDVTGSKFRISPYEITNLQYAHFLNSRNVGVDGILLGKQLIENNSISLQIEYIDFKWKPIDGYENHPMVAVTWYGATAYCDWVGGRLPTVKEWQQAAKGGNNSAGYTYSGSNELQEVAWYKENSGFETHPVGQKKPNELGIYDMNGNVWEWCSDSNNGFSQFIGGGINNTKAECLLDFTSSSTSISGHSVVGFRPVYEANN